MKKNLIALAVAGAFVAPVAMAETANVNIYGAVNMSYENISHGTSTAGVAGANTSNISSNVSKIGFKGSEDLGGGLSAIWQIEQQINVDNSTTTANTFASRNSFAGLSSNDMGTVLMGRHDTPYKIATRGLDLFADTIADNRSLMGMSAGGLASATAGVSGVATLNHDQRLGDVVAYISPAMNGFTAAVAYVAGAESATTSGQVKGAAWSLAGMYTAGPLNASLSYQVIDVGTAGTGTMGATGAMAANDKAKAWKLGGGYTLDALQLNAIYEKTSGTVAALGGDGVAQANWYLAAKYSFGNDAVKLAYTNAGKNPQGAGLVNVVNSDASQISLGYDHNLSKRTTVYALYSKISNKAAANYGFSSVGTTAIGTNTGAGADPSVFALGMKHSF